MSRSRPMTFALCAVALVAATTQVVAQESAAGTPKAIVDRYNAVFNEILAQPSVRAVLDKQGLIARGGPSERLAELIAKDRLRWAKVVKDAEITSE